MKLKIDKEWCLNAAKAEEEAGDPECGVGSHTAIGLRMMTLSEATKKELEAIDASLRAGARMASKIISD